MPTAARSRSERRKRKARSWSLLGAVAMGLATFAFPKYPVVLWLCGLVTFAASIPAAMTGYKDQAKPLVWIPILFAHAAAIIGVLWIIWPVIKVGPKHASFSGYPDETFSFAVRNEKTDDVYDVEVPFLIGYGRHLDEKFKAKVYSSGDPPQYIRDYYSYCYGKGPDVHRVLPNEQEVLVVKIRHIPPSGNASFSITYSGGDKVETDSGRPTFRDDPYSYAPTMGRTGVRGDYRICRYSMSIEQPEK